MSVGMASVPPWKQALIEKRKQLEEEEKQINSLPSWKRDILARKRGQKNTMIFLGRERSPSPVKSTSEHAGKTNHTEHEQHTEQISTIRVSAQKAEGGRGRTTSTDNKEILVNGDDSVEIVLKGGPDEGHLIPLDQNPWVLSDRKTRKSSSTSTTRTFSTGSRKSSEPNTSAEQSLSPAYNHIDSGNERHVSTTDDSAFAEPQPEEEVQYGKGFVHKLLQRFAHLSTREKSPDSHFNHAPRRTHSMEDLLDDSGSPGSLTSNKRDLRPRSLQLSNSPHDLSKAGSMGHLSGPLSPNDVDDIVRSMSPKRDRSLSPDRTRNRSLSPELERKRSFSPDLARGSSSSPVLLTHYRRVGSPVHMHSSPDHTDHSDLRTVRSPSPSSKRSSYPKHFYFTGIEEVLLHKELPKPNIVSSTRSIFEHEALSPTNSEPEAFSWDVPDSTVSKENSVREITEPHLPGSRHNGDISNVSSSAYRKGGHSDLKTVQSEHIVNGNTKEIVPKDRGSKIEQEEPERTRSVLFNNRDYPPSRTFYQASVPVRSTGVKSSETSEPETVDSGREAHSHVLNNTGSKETKENGLNLHKTHEFSRNAYLPDKKGKMENAKKALPPVTIPSNYSVSSESSETLSPPVTSPTAPPRTKKRRAPLRPDEEKPPSLPSSPPSDASSASVFLPEESKSNSRIFSASMPEQRKSDTQTSSSTIPEIKGNSMVFAAKTPAQGQTKPEPLKPRPVPQKRETIPPTVKPTPAQQKPAPALVRPTPAAQKPVTVQQKVAPVEEKPASVQQIKDAAPVPAPEKVETRSQGDEAKTKPTSLPKTENSKTENQISNLRNATQPPKHNAFITRTDKPGASSSGITKGDSGVSLKATSYRDYSGATLLTPDDQLNEPPSKAPRTNLLRRRRRAGRPGPGILTVKPASNQVMGSNKSSQLNFPNLLKYRDVTKATFENSIKAADYLSSEDLQEIYITDVPGQDLPVTDIDDVLADVSTSDGEDVTLSPRLNVNRPTKLPESYEFEGAGVKLGRSLLAKNRPKKNKLTFYESVLTYEYPSEASMMEMIPPEPLSGEPDKQTNSPTRLSFDEEDMDIQEPGSLRSTPGVGSAGALGSYRSRMQQEYQFGMNRQEPASRPAPVQSQRPAPQQTNVKPAQEDQEVTWSGSNSSDLLF